jgi:hypothetical protein
MAPKRYSGSTIHRALPITLRTGTGPFAAARESTELFRLSPITQRLPGGTRTGPNAACWALPNSGAK